MGSFDDVRKAQDPLAEPRQALRTCRGVQATRTEARDKGSALRRIPALGIDVWRRILEQAGLTGTRRKTCEKWRIFNGLRAAGQLGRRIRNVPLPGNIAGLWRDFGRSLDILDLLPPDLI